jgi:DNA-binding NtrC family response regulator
MDTRSGAILLVDDDASIRSVLCAFLENQGYTVLVAASGEEALLLGKDYQGTIVLVITDMLMPGISGQEVVQQLLIGRPGLRVIYMSGYCEETATVGPPPKVLSVFLAKPFTMTELAKAVQVLTC